MKSEDELVRVIDSGSVSALASLLAEGFDPNQLLEALTPLTHATMNDATEIVELLLKNGANVSGRNRDGSTALSTANLEITALLLQYGAKVSDELGVQAPSCLHYAASLGQTERLRLLLSERADGRSCLLWLDPEGKTPLGCGVEAGEVEVVKLLLNSGAEIDDNELTVDFNRPLALAADYGHQHVLELLEAWKTAKGK